MPKNSIEVQYHCDECTIDFVVYHMGSERNTHCCWCGKEVRMTGILSKIKNNEIITYKDGKEIGRRPIPNPFNKPT